MRNEYTTPEVVEIGKAQEMILGPKEGGTVDILAVFESSLDLDE
jgi:hypothetical protein